mmetsp:Transcript_12968/g.34943  ORF Transcript_12968/g.34943 Transcript_12968/m.34943 type:complete len:220 (-) Transcript_12968:256-915(-)
MGTGLLLWTCSRSSLCCSSARCVVRFEIVVQKRERRSEAQLAARANVVVRGCCAVAIVRHLVYAQFVLTQVRVRRGGEAASLSAQKRGDLEVYSDHVVQQCGLVVRRVGAFCAPMQPLLRGVARLWLEHFPELRKLLQNWSTAFQSHLIHVRGRIQPLQAFPFLHVFAVQQFDLCTMYVLIHVAHRHIFSRLCVSTSFLEFICVVALLQLNAGRVCFVR